MTSLLSTIFGVFSYIIAGFILKKINVIPDNISKTFDFASFNVLLPLALVTNFWIIKFPDVIVYQLVLAFFGAGVLVFILAFIIGKKLYQFKPDDSALFGLSACFGNSVAFGIPLMYSILGPINAMPYMILVLFHGFIHFTYTTLIIEGFRNRSQSGIKRLTKTIFGLIKNIVLVGMFVGIFLNYAEIPFPSPLKIILLPIAKIALPAVLISLGFALAGFKLANQLSYSLVLTILKNFIHPMLGFFIAKFIFDMTPLLVFIVTVAAALPSGSQSYYFSYRYNSLQDITSANIVLSTFVSFFTLSILILMLGY
ncbi:AEC family transporter [Alphaproteobacteria bacterium]|nr:AEC family transporter [Alphaproteobacteria bacterium]